MNNVYNFEPSCRPSSSLEEQLRDHGAEQLTNDDLVTLVLGDSVNPIEKKRIVGEILTAIRRSHGETEYFQKIFDILGLEGQHASTIIACLQLAQRYLFHKKRTVETPGEVYRFFLYPYSGYQEELFLSISINSAQEVTHIREISKGAIDKAIIRPREVFAHALVDRAATIIVAHNHPSGKVIPSQEDIKITKQIIQAGQLIGIPLLDHIVFSKENYFSFRENNKIEELL